MSGVKRKSMVEHRHCAPKKDKPSTVEHQEQKQDFSSIDTIEVHVQCKLFIIKQHPLLSLLHNNIFRTS